MGATDMGSTMPRGAKGMEATEQTRETPEPRGVALPSKENPHLWAAKLPSHHSSKHKRKQAAKESFIHATKMSRSCWTRLPSFFWAKESLSQAAKLQNCSAKQRCTVEPRSHWASKLSCQAAGPRGAAPLSHQAKGIQVLLGAKLQRDKLQRDKLHKVKLPIIVGCHHFLDCGVVVVVMMMLWWLLCMLLTVVTQKNIIVFLIIDSNVEFF